MSDELAASICSYDRDLVLELLDIVSAEKARCRAARDAELAAGNPFAELCDTEGQQAEVIFGLLRRVLRLLAERRLEGDRERRRRSHQAQRERSRRTRDVSLPGLDPADGPQLFEAG